MGVIRRMEVNEILCAVEAGIKTRYPQEPVYWNLLPKGYARPSFTLECTTEEMADVNAGLVRRSATVLATCYADVDDYKDSERRELNARMDAVLALFGSGVCTVGDRSIRVSAAKGIGAPDASEVFAVFTWTDTRPGYKDPEVGAPVMEHYALNVMRKE